MDVTGLNIGIEWLRNHIAEASSTTNQLRSPITSFGDELPSGAPGFNFEDSSDPSEPIRRVERTRRYYDKSRIGVECMGVGDVLLSGEVSFFFSFFFFLFL